MERCILAIDQGTTGTTVLLLDERATIVCRGYAEVACHYPHPSWVEQDASVLWQSVLAAASEALGEAPVEVVAIGVTNQRETVVLWDRESGAPVAPAIVWQCRRTADLCREHREQGLEPLFRERTGLLFDAYFSGTKIEFLLRGDPDLAARARAGALAAGTVDSWLVWQLTGGRAHITDPSNASRTLLYDLHRRAWSAELAEALGVPLALLPEVRSSSEVYGHTRGVPGLPDGIPVAGIAGDQQAALFGQGCWAEGQAKITYGTGAFLLTNTGGQPVPSHSGLLTTVAWQVGDEFAYALEGSVFIAGAAVQWLRDELGILGSVAESEALARQVEDSGGVWFVPAFVGLGAPYWDMNARGAILGLTRGAGRAHLARAALEGISHQVADVAEAMAADTGRPLDDLHVDGGAAANDLLLEIQADLCGLPVQRPRNVETTAAGAAFLAGLATGFWSHRAELRQALVPGATFTPHLAPPDRAARRAAWRRAVAAARYLAESPANGA